MSTNPIAVAGPSRLSSDHLHRDEELGPLPEVSRRASKQLERLEIQRSRELATPIPLSLRLTTSISGAPPSSSPAPAAAVHADQYTPRLYVAAPLVAAHGWLFGFDTGSIGPVTEMPTFYGLSASLQGVVVATILFTALIFSLVSGPLSDRYSRVTIMSVGSAIFALGSVIAASSQDLGMFLGGRAITGIGEGLFYSPVGVWLIECAPKEKRGEMGGMLQVSIVCGVAAGYFCTYGTSYIESAWQWRIPYLCQAVYATTLCLIVRTRLVPESPRWLLLRSDRPHTALTIVEAFALSPQTAELEKAELVERCERDRAEREAREANLSRHRSLGERIGIDGFAECFNKEESKRFKTAVGLFFMGIQQLSGIDAVLFYAPSIFTQAGLNSRQGSFLASGVSGIVGVLAMIPAQIWLVDKLGRRVLTVTGGAIQGLSLLIIGGLFASGATKQHSVVWAVAAMIYIFMAAFQMTWSPVLKTYCTEIQPNSTRANVAAMAQCINWVVNIFIALATPPFLDASPSGPFFLFGACCLIGAAAGLLMPETKGLSIQSIDAAWEETTHRNRARIQQARRLASKHFESKGHSSQVMYRMTSLHAAQRAT